MDVAALGALTVTTRTSNLNLAYDLRAHHAQPSSRPKLLAVRARPSHPSRCPQSRSRKSPHCLNSRVLFRRLSFRACSMASGLSGDAKRKFAEARAAAQSAPNFGVLGQIGGPLPGTSLDRQGGGPTVPHSAPHFPPQQPGLDPGRNLLLGGLTPPEAAGRGGNSPCIDAHGLGLVVAPGAQTQRGLSPSGGSQADKCPHPGTPLQVRDPPAVAPTLQVRRWWG